MYINRACPIREYHGSSLKERLKKGKPAQKRAMIGLKTYILLRLCG
jgi:hypothetical protein